MDYTRIYTNIITHAKQHSPSGYTERHHIIPRSMGGSNASDNLVRLTPKAHFVCHLCLVRMTHGRDRAKMSLAAKRLIDSKHPAYTRVRITGRLYAALRETIAADARDRMRQVNTGVPKGESWKAQMSERMRGNQHSKGKTLPPRTSAHREKLSRAAKERHKNSAHPMRGRHHSDETRLKISQAKRGHTLTSEHTERIRQARLGMTYKKRINSCHAELPHYSGGLCNACYWKQWREKKKNAVESKPHGVSQQDGSDS